MPLMLRVAVRSDKGLVRASNEDSVYASSHLLVVADGMGGHAAGEVASAAVVAHMARIAPVGPADDPGVPLLAGILAGNADIARQVAKRPELDGMGTTVTAVLLTADGRFAVGNVGDSRTYLFRDGMLSLITRDDSFVQTLVERGRISAAEAATHPHRSVVTQALVGDESLEPKVTLLYTQPGDRLLLCSDGLSDFVAHEELAWALRTTDPEAAADRLIELALQAGGSDNISVIVADVTGDPAETVTAPVGDPLGATAGTAQQAPDVEARARRRVMPLLLLVTGLLAAGICWLILQGS